MRAYAFNISKMITSILRALTFQDQMLADKVRARDANYRPAGW